MQDQIYKIVELGYFKFVDDELIAYLKGNLLEALKQDTAFISTLTLDNYYKRCLDNIAHSFLVDHTCENISFYHDLHINEMCDLISHLSLDLRVLSLDSQKLIDGEAEKILKELTDVGVFKRCGLNLGEIKRYEAGSDYEIFVNGLPFTLVRADSVDALQEAYINFGCMLNELLLSAGSQERFYGLGSGESVKLWLLDRSLFEHISGMELTKGWKPVELTL